jgi:hypothetical protein
MAPYRSGRRRSKRTISVVPVQLWIAGSEDSRPAHTLDVSTHGMKLAGCRGEFKVGDKIEVLSRHKRAQFRIAWITAREALRRSKSGLNAWSRENKSGVRSSPSKRMKYEEKH